VVLPIERATALLTSLDARPGRGGEILPVDRAESHEQNDLVLRPPLATFVERTAARGSGSVDTAAIEKIWNGFADLGAFEARVIENEAEPPQETAGRVLELLPERWPTGVDDRSR
jgi:hypothetical protein